MVAVVRRRAGIRAVALVAFSAGCASSNTPDTGIPPFDVVDVIVRRDGATPARDASTMDTGDEHAVPDDVAVAEAGDDVPAIDVVMDTQAHVRLGNLMAPAGSTPPPAVDVCVRPTGSSSMTFIGPVFEGTGLTAGVAWNQVSAYMDVPPGMYDVAIVSADAIDCNAPILPVLSAVDFGAAGSWSSVIFHGKPSVPPDGGTDAFAFRAILLADHDPAMAVAEPKPRLRLFHAQTVSLALDVGLSPDSSTFSPIFRNVSFGQVGQPAEGLEAMFDAQHFFASDISDAAAPVGARIACPVSNPACTNPALLRISIFIPAHSYMTSFVASVMNGTSVGLGSVVCIDSNPAVAGLSDCRICTSANNDANPCR